MKRTMTRIFHRRTWMSAAAVVFALLLVCSSTLPVLAGPTQEKGEEEKKEEKSEPKKYTNSDLKGFPSSSGSGGEAPAEAGDVPEGADGETTASEGEAADPWSTVGVATDSQGRGEEYWRKAMSDARAELTRAKRKHDSLQSEMNKCRVDFTAIDDPAARALVQDRIEELYGELDMAAEAVAAAEQALADLEEEARRSGALPGWLR